MSTHLSKRQIKVYHPSATEPVGIMPNQLAHFEANGWSTKKPTTSTKRQPVVNKKSTKNIT